MRTRPDRKATRPQLPTESGRVGRRRSAKRQSIIDAASDIIAHHGYATVTYRSVAAAADVTPGLVQYYFPALDELFIAVLRQSTDRLVDGLRAAAESQHPLRAIWRYANDSTGTALLVEFMALANHRPAIGTVIGEDRERAGAAALAAITPRWPEYGLDLDRIPPSAVVFALTAIARMAHLEESLGTTIGHAEAVTMIDDFLDRIEPTH